MPRENRKRGRRVKKKVDESNETLSPQESQVFEPTSGPSWIRSTPRHDPEDDMFNPEAPFGYVDADVKAYFRTVDVQMRDWQVQEDQELDQDKDQNEGAFYLMAETDK